MDRRELDEIERFLSTVGQPSLLAYYGLTRDSPADERENAVKKRRSWAQGQQANPKYKAEALFLIKNNAVLKRACVDDFAGYLELVTEHEVKTAVDDLSAFIRRAIVGGVLSAQGEAAIRLQGRGAGMSDTAVSARIDEILADVGAVRGDIDEDAISGSTAALDLYGILQVAPNADLPILEAAYRARYRWARNVKDIKRSSEALHQLDEAWRVLRDPERRRRYDSLRADAHDVTDEVQRSASRPIEPAHEGEPPPFSMDMPSDAAPRLKEATLPPRVPLSAERKERSLPPSPDRIVSKTERQQRAAEPPAPPPEPPKPPEPAPELRMRDAPVPNIPGRTIGLASGPQTVRDRAPRLSVQGPSTVRLSAGARAVDHGLNIVNNGQGKMPGKLVSDVPWLVPQKLWLDPLAREQQIVVSVRPERMPRRHAVGTVTVVADHGERRVVTFDVHRRSYVVPLLIALLLACAIGIAYGWLAVHEPTAAPPQAMLSLTVDPFADRVFVDGKPAGTGSAFQLEEPVPGEPFRLRVETDGFAPHEELVALRGQRLERSVTLTLDDPMAWVPPSGEASVDVTESVRKTLERRAPELLACVSRPPPEPAAAFHALVDTAGQVRALRVDKANFPVAPALDCFRRSFRSIRVDPLPQGYGTVDLLLPLGSK